MNQRQCKRYRKAIKKLDKERERFWRAIDYLNRRPPVWRIRSYIKWRKEGAEIWTA